MIYTKHYYGARRFLHLEYGGLTLYSKKHAAAGMRIIYDVWY